jgi:hypothetical protein
VLLKPDSDPRDEKTQALDLQLLAAAVFQGYPPSDPTTADRIGIPQGQRTEAHGDGDLGRVRLFADAVFQQSRGLSVSEPAVGQADIEAGSFRPMAKPILF